MSDRRRNHRPRLDDDSPRLRRDSLATPIRVVGKQYQYTVLVRLEPAEIRSVAERLRHPAADHRLFRQSEKILFLYGVDDNFYSRKKKMAKAEKVTRGPLFCRKEFRGKGLKGKTSPLWCPDCHLRVRGPNHADGYHHKHKGKGPVSRGY